MWKYSLGTLGSWRGIKTNKMPFWMLSSSITFFRKPFDFNTAGWVGWASLPRQHSVLNLTHFSIPATRLWLSALAWVLSYSFLYPQGRAELTGNRGKPSLVPGSVLNTLHLYMPYLILVSYLYEVITIIILILQTRKLSLS